LSAIGTVLTVESEQFLDFHGRSFGWLRMVAVYLRKKIRAVHNRVAVVRELLAMVKLVKLHELSMNDVDLRILVLPKMFDVVWAYNVMDINNAISGACRRLFADASVNSRYQRLERAEAIRILGEEFLSVAKREMERIETEETILLPEYIVARVEVAVEMSVLKVRLML
jgi:hypothetical protein